ncbi:MAG: hypothetical protein U1E27_01145, partial [Kiritimatiellia bacterium]|nr:hypothetical protein [Kiritimatiellia bacterium]
TNLITATSKVLVAESPEDGHWILRPQWPQDHGEYWAGTRLQQIPLFLRHTLPAGASAPIDAWVEYATSGESSPVIRSTLQIVDFPWVPRPLQRMVVNDMWMRLNDYRTWPNYVSALRKSGFTGISFFAGDLLDDGGQADRSYDREWVDARRAQIVELAREARETGLGVYLMDTTFNKVGFSRESQWGGLKGSGPLADPTYRGPIYWDDIADLTTAYEHLGGADWISIDTEVHKRVTERHFGYFDKAPDAAARILAQAKEKGTTVEDIFTDYGTEMIADVRAAIRKSNETLGIANVPPILIWNFSADEENPMEGLFEFRKLYPDLLPYLYPHVYFMSDSRKIGDRIKKHRRILGKSDIIACVTTSHFSQRDNLRYTELRDQLLECFFNGARGIEYWPALNDHNHLYGQLLALREIRPFEDLLLDGEYIVQTDDAAPTQIAGFIRDNEAVFLVSDYRLDFDGVIRVRNPFDQEQAVFHISESRSLGRVGPGESLDIRLEERRTAVLYFGDRYTGPEAP